MKGSEIVYRVLKEQGITDVFGYPGGTVLSLFDAFRAHRGIKLRSCNHEQFCVHAAEGYARASGKIGVVIATSGPGATNLVTGLADAFMDSIPLVAITGNVPLELLGRDAFQEIDIYGVTMPITKHNMIVKSADRLANSLREAFRIAREGRPGPVLVDIPRNVFEENAPYTAVPPLPCRNPVPTDAAIGNAAELINSSLRPLLCLGGGAIASDACDEVYALAQTLGCPVATTAMGIGAYPQNEAQYVGLVGMHLNEGTEKALAETDLFIASGIRFSERMLSNLERYSPNCKVLHLDIDEAEIDKNKRVYSAVVGDLKTSLQRLLPLISVKEKRVYPFTERREKLFTELFETFPEAIFTTEVGAHQIRACHGLPIRTPRSFLTSGGLGTMGFGLPAAIGASVATGKRVVNLAGDGSFRMNLQELSTAVKYRLPVLQIVFDNNGLGMIRSWQEERYNGRVYMTEVPPMDTVALAKAMGVPFAVRVGADGFADALAKAKRCTHPALIELTEEP